MKAIVNANVVLENEILPNAAILIERGRILAVGPMDVLLLPDCPQIDAGGRFVGPGFVDIHCHAGGTHWAHDNPPAMARFHLEGGTTSLNCTIYHDIGEEGAIRAFGKIRAAMELNDPGNIMGVHFEGPFFNPKYGARAKTIRPVDRREYMRHIAEAGDIIRMWTVAPEIENARQFILDVRAAGIPVALGHSEASYEDVLWAVEHGASVCTHILNATGASISPTRWIGTQEVTFDDAVLLCDGVYVELINDSDGIHVRPELVRLVLKTVGVDYVVGITDCSTGSLDDSDINLENGELCGSKMRMYQAARNFKHNARLDMPDVFKVCARNPARAMHRADIGLIEPGRQANFVFIDEEYAGHQVMLRGDVVVDNDR